MDTPGTILDALDRIAGLFVRGSPHLSLINIGADGFDIYPVADGMKARGRATGRAKEPPALHVYLTPVHTRVVGDFVADLEAAAADARDGRIEAQQPGAVYAS